MTNLLSYLFWPRPPVASYDNPKVIALFTVCGLLVLASFALRIWRKNIRSGVTRKLSRSWGSTSLVFGLVGLILTVSRTEDISFVSMRFLWVLWGLAAILYCIFQVRMFRAKHYETLPTERSEDPREAYLPKKKK